MNKTDNSQKLKILLLTNYRLDFQKSMLRFSNQLLNFQYSHRIDYYEIYPKPILYRIPANRTLKKWAGYIDKYFLFPRLLKKTTKSTQFDYMHIVDHSNAVYIPKSKFLPVLITCHDLIAVQTAQQKFSEAPNTSNLSKRLQLWILKSLSQANYFACDSNSTKKDLNILIPTTKNRSEVIHLGVCFERHIKNINHEMPFNPKTTRFLLHVGSSAWYKNRKRIFEAFVELKNGQHFNKLKLVLVGPVPQPEELTDQTEQWLNNNSKELIVLSDSSESVLQTLYEHADAFIFPSLIEGFGWPPLEARALGCSVIASRTGAMSDILGSSATYVDPMSTKDIVSKTINVLAEDKANRPPPKIPKARECVQAYENLYQRLVGFR